MDWQKLAKTLQVIQVIKYYVKYITLSFCILLHFLKYVLPLFLQHLTLYIIYIYNLLSTFPPEKKERIRESKIREIKGVGYRLPLYGKISGKVAGYKIAKNHYNQKPKTRRKKNII